MGLIALAFFDPRSSRDPQRLLESAIGKNADLTLEPKQFKILIFAASVTQDKWYVQLDFVRQFKNTFFGICLCIIFFNKSMKSNKDTAF
jgi:hypothetical protein